MKPTPYSGFYFVIRLSIFRVKTTFYNQKASNNCDFVA